MANLKEIRTRIGSVKSTRQITSAMKLVSAAKLRKSQDRITQLKPYAEQLQNIMSSVGHTLSENEDFTLVQKRPISKVLMVMVSSNRGLCGAFNSNVVKKTMSEIKEKYPNTEVHLMCVGKKAADISKKFGYEIVKKENEIFDDLNFENASILSEQLMKWYETGEYDAIQIIYNSFKNSATQILKVEEFLPLVIEESKDNNVSDYIFEPGEIEISKELVPKALKTQFFKALLDSNAAENGARMTAMHLATDNATELIQELTLQFNKARQSAITNEILEITSGAEALKD
jgi:F-type H+-transporting ATPase subunit gamma